MQNFAQFSGKLKILLNCAKSMQNTVHKCRLHTMSSKHITHLLIFVKIGVDEVCIVPHTMALAVFDAGALFPLFFNWCNRDIR